MRVSSASRRSVGSSIVPSARTAPCAISVKPVSLRSANTSLRCAAALNAPGPSCRPRRHRR